MDQFSGGGSVRASQLIPIPTSNKIFFKGDIVEIVGDMKNPEGIQRIKGFIRNSQGMVVSRLSEIDKVYEVQRGDGKANAKVPAAYLKLLRRGPRKPWTEDDNFGWNSAEERAPAIGLNSTPLRRGEAVDVTNEGRGVVVRPGKTSGMYLVELDCEKPYGKPKQFHKLKLNRVLI